MPSGDTRKGHRKRLCEKFVKSGLKGFHDYEIIELLLTLGTPRKDCKRPAKETIKRFETLRGVLEAPTEELQQIDGIGSHSTFGIKLMQEVAPAWGSVSVMVLWPSMAVDCTLKTNQVWGLPSLSNYG